jgi:Tfp pilus assembly protein PilZ
VSAIADRPVRRHRRVTVRVPARYGAEGSSRQVDAVVTTLGAGGVFIPSETPLPAGCHVRVLLRLGRVAHELHGRVVWANDATVAGVPASGRGMGIAFIDAAAQERLAQALAELEGSEL